MFCLFLFFFFKQKTAYEMRISDWSSDVCSSDLQGIGLVLLVLIFAMMLYPVSLKVAATRSELTRIERDIVRARDNIRYLESELAVRASMRQQIGSASCRERVVQYG